ncbi:hypothetical protein QQ045_016305 [Rhodiola kirilowii]
MTSTPPQIAILGAGTFVKTQYIPRLAEISHLFSLKSIWSRTQESAQAAVELARSHFPQVECKWGDSGLQDIISDCSILGVAVVLAGQAQVDFSLRLLKEGKHVLQVLLNVTAISELETAFSQYNSIFAESPRRPIWAVAENYRFELIFAESKKLMPYIGEMMSVQVIVEGSMNSSNPYFTSSWRRNFTGGFILDMGVHFVAGLRMLVGCEVESVSAMTSHVDLSLPPPDNISSLLYALKILLLYCNLRHSTDDFFFPCFSKLENGCSGVFQMIVSSRSPKACHLSITWRVVGLTGTLQVERGSKDGKQGYTVSLYSSDGQCKSYFYPFSGVTEELKAFIHDISSFKADISFKAEPRLSFTEGARDVAVLDAMLESAGKGGNMVQVKKF